MIGSILIFLLVLSILILVHEFGHFWVARRAGIWVEEFGIGLPPRVIAKKFGETIYSVNALPFGGFVRLHGENTEEAVKKPDHAFIKKSKKIRITVITAGVVMNFILAIGLFSIVSSFRGIPRETENVRVLEIQESSPAMTAGMQVDDFVRELGGEKITSTTQFIESIDQKMGVEAVIVLERDGTLIETNIVPRENPPEGEGSLGVVISSSEIYFPPLWQRPFIGVYYGFQEALFWGGAVIAGFFKIFQDLFSGQLPKDLAGPVGIYAITSQAASFGFLALINFVAILSVNLAILNILPFPALDGGRLLFIVVESIFGKRVVPRVESSIHAVGMIILILLLIAITAHDIRRISSAGGLSQFIESILK